MRKRRRGGTRVGASGADVAQMTGRPLAEVERVLRGLVARRVLYEIGQGRYLPNPDPETWLPEGGAHGESAV